MTTPRLPLAEQLVLAAVRTMSPATSSRAQVGSINCKNSDTNVEHIEMNSQTQKDILKVFYVSVWLNKTFNNNKTIF